MVSEVLSSTIIDCCQATNFWIWILVAELPTGQGMSEQVFTSCTLMEWRFHSSTVKTCQDNREAFHTFTSQKQVKFLWAILNLACGCRLPCAYPSTNSRSANLFTTISPSIWAPIQTANLWLPLHCITKIWKKAAKSASVLDLSSYCQFSQK